MVIVYTSWLVKSIVYGLGPRGSVISTGEAKVSEVMNIGMDQE